MFFLVFKCIFFMIKFVVDCVEFLLGESGIFVGDRVILRLLSFFGLIVVMVLRGMFWMGEICLL